MSLWIKAISDIGFPIVITLYLLSRIENKLDMLNVSIRNLPQQLSSRLQHSPASTMDAADTDKTRPVYSPDGYPATMDPTDLYQPTADPDSDTQKMPTAYSSNLAKKPANQQSNTTNKSTAR